MFKLLRNPVALLVLTAAALLWTFHVASLPRDSFKTLLDHRRIDSPPFEFIDGYTHRPVYELARMCLGKTTDRTSEIELSLYRVTLIVRDAGGLRVHELGWDTNGDEWFGFEAVATVFGKRQVDEYGFLAGVAVRLRTSVEAYPIPTGSTNNLTRAELDEALNNSLNPDAPRVINGVQTTWVFKPLAAAHDLAYIGLLLGWTYAILAIPRWALWRRRNGCPTCNYPTEGLPSPTCPECVSRHQAHAS